MFPILNRETQCKLLENETKQLAEAAFSLLQWQTLLQGTINLREGLWAILFSYKTAMSQDKLTTSNNTVVQLI